MTVTYSLFVRWMLAKGHTSQREAAKALGVSPMGPSNWKNGHNAAAHVVERMAKDLGEDPTAHIIAVFQETAKGPDARTLQRMAKRLGYGAVLAVALALPAPPAAAVDGAGVYIMRSRKRRKRSANNPTICGLTSEVQRQDGAVRASCATFLAGRTERNGSTPLHHPRPSTQRLRPWRVRVRNKQHSRPNRAVARLEATRRGVGIAR